MTPPLDRWLDAFLREALELVGAERGTVLLGFAAGETISRSRGMPAGPEALAAMAEIARLAGSKAGHRSTRVAYGIDHRPGLLVTLEHQERQLGLVYLDRERRPFHDEDLRKLEALCAQEAAELQARLQAPPTPAQRVRQKLEQAAAEVEFRRWIAEALAEARQRLARDREPRERTDTGPASSASEELLAEVKPAEAPLSGSLLLMAAQDRELPASEMAALEDRMAIADPILQSEWEWLARARAAVGAFEPARASVADLAALQQRVELALAGRAELGATLEQLGLPLPEAELDASASLLEAMTASWNELMAQAGLPDRPAADEVAFRARLEVDVARWIQHMPLPERPPSAATGLELAAALEEAPGSGSNAWGFVELERGELFAWVVDASGRGVESACFLLEAGAAFRAALEPGASPAAVLARVNLALSRAEAAMFASALLVRWDADARRLTLASGGHEHAAVFRTARRRVELVRAEGVVLGLGRRIPVNAFRDQAIDFAPGDALLLHTSGVIEVSGAAPEAEQRALFAAFARHGEESATGILAALREDLQRRHGPVRHDDRTLLVIKRR